MTFIAIAKFIETFGPAALQALPLLEKLYANIKEGRGSQEATPADWAELNRLRALTAEDIYERLGITPPPPKPTQ